VVVVVVVVAVGVVVVVAVVARVRTLIHGVARQILWMFLPCLNMCNL
jgi:hypothetical protein